MTDKLDYAAKIRAKGCNATGITEDVARQMHSRKGKKYMGIVELEVDETHDKKDGQRKVDLVLVQVEPCLDDQLETHLRQLTATLHQNRKLNSDSDQLQIGTAEDLEPSVADVIADQKAHDAETPHPFVADDDHPENCWTCGAGEPAEVHQTVGEPAEATS